MKPENVARGLITLLTALRVAWGIRLQTFLIKKSGGHERRAEFMGVRKPFGIERDIGFVHAR